MTQATRAAAPQSVERIFAILDHLAAHPEGESLAGLARTTGAPKTSLVGLLAGMVESQHLVRDGHGAYRLGPRLVSLALRISSRTDLASLARPVVADLTAQTGETAIVCVLDPAGNAAISIVKVESTNPVRYAVTLGDRRELYCTAAGKALLAWQPRKRRDDYLRSAVLLPFASKTVTSRKVLAAQLEEIRRTGIACTESERVEGATGLAVPVFGPDGQVLACIMLAVPTHRFGANRPRLEERLRAAGRRLTELVAGRQPSGPASDGP